KRDVGDMLLLEFNKATLNEIEESYNFGIKVEEWMKIYFSRMKDVSLTKIDEFVINKVEARDGFVDMISFFSKMRIPFEVVSGGLDIYIKPFMKKYGVYFSGFYGIFNNGVVDYPFLNNMTLSQFKASRVIYYRSIGYTVAFLGDSPNDYDAAMACDIRFVTLKLKDIFSKEGKTHISYESLKDVIKVINETISS
ncbi:MAG: haloacid dehalogenase-like hydrolase, partial [Elusimicrobiales bacterium]|nr:haloacid dehalogenase-like hydrolase [Elusimicrobiales bacterium]